MVVRLAAVLGVLVIGMACTDGASPPPFGSHCDDYGPDFAEAHDSPDNSARRAECTADPECRVATGRFTYTAPGGYCNDTAQEYVACIPNVVADPNACAAGATSLPGGPTWGEPVSAPGECFRMETPCLPEGWTDCSDPGVVLAGTCF